MRAVKQIRVVPPGLHDSSAELLAHFSAATVELNPSLGTPELARRLTSRATEMLGARAAVLALNDLPNWQIQALSGPANRWHEAVQRALAARFEELAGAPWSGVRAGSAARLLGSELAEALGWQEIALALLARGDERTFGILGLADLANSPSETKRQLLQALASHAAVSFENVRMIQRIEQSRKRWVEDVDAISDFILVHDETGKVLRLNRALAGLLKVHPSEAIGWDVGALELLTTSPARQCPFCRNSDTAVEEFTHQSGGRTYLISTSRLQPEDSGPRTVHVLKDITDKREAERRYRRERDFNRNILNNTRSMIMVLDTAGLISYSNKRCADAGYCEKELLGQPLAGFVPASRRASFAEAFDRSLEGSPIELEIPLSRGFHTVGQFSVSLSPMRDEQGNINSIVVVMADVTDAVDLQAKLMHTEKMAALGQLVSGVAHEVNNPLAAIVGFTDLLLENQRVPADAKRDLQIILQEAQRTRTIVQNLLSFARQMPAQHEPVELNSVVRQTIQLRAYDSAKKGIEIVEHYDGSLPLFVGDPHQLQQVFLNILNNAHDAVQESGQGGKIEITTSHFSGHIEISFRDNGPGISHPDRIFDPFFTTKEVGKGTGLGLSICYGIVRSHQGDILARNNADGPGATFTVRLPAMKAATPARRRAVPSEAAEAPAGTSAEFLERKGNHQPL
jgi:PAS domain S-box-containing protein